VPRTLDLEAHAVRRDAFVDVGQRLITSKGYDDLSIQDVLDEVGASKGAFYHYFDSKAALLEAVVDRMTTVAVAAVTPVVNEPDLPALEKFHALFTQLADWKFERKDLVLALMEVWFSDENTMMRDKFRRSYMTRITPLFATIIRQGVAEGAFTATSPDHTAAVMVGLLQGVTDSASQLFLDYQAGRVTRDEVDRTLASFGEALERILGVRPGMLRLVDPETITLWFG
jgi:AcrR family transcriptional regulator